MDAAQTHDASRNIAAIRRTMRLVLLTLLPAMAAHTYFFGYGLVIHLALAIASGLVFELLALAMRGRPLLPGISDLAMLVTAALLAF